MPTKDEIMAALRRVNDPEIGRNLVDLNMIHDLKLEPDGRVGFTIALTIPACPLRDQMAGDARAAVGALKGVSGVDIQFRPMNDAERKAVFGMSQAPSLPKLNQLNQVNSTPQLHQENLRARR